MILLKQEVIDILKAVASREMWMDEEDFNPQEASGFNYDDAYHMGINDGETSFAIRICKRLNIKYEGVQ